MYQAQAWEKTAVEWSTKKTVISVHTTAVWSDKMRCEGGFIFIVGVFFCLSIPAVGVQCAIKWWNFKSVDCLIHTCYVYASQLSTLYHFLKLTRNFRVPPFFGASTIGTAHVLERESTTSFSTISTISELWGLQSLDSAWYGEVCPGNALSDKFLQIFYNYSSKITILYVVERLQHLK